MARNIRLYVQNDLLGFPSSLHLDSLVTANSRDHEKDGRKDLVEIGKKRREVFALNGTILKLYWIHLLVRCNNFKGRRTRITQNVHNQVLYKFIFKLLNIPVLT